MHILLAMRSNYSGGRSVAPQPLVSPAPLQTAQLRMTFETLRSRQFETAKFCAWPTLRRVKTLDVGYKAAAMPTSRTPHSRAQCSWFRQTRDHDLQARAERLGDLTQFDLHCRESDPTFPRLTSHGLRHTAASLAISAGAHPKLVQRMLGHASAAMTLDGYADLFDSDLASVAEAWARMWARYSEPHRFPGRKQPLPAPTDTQVRSPLSGLN